MEDYTVSHTGSVLGDEYVSTTQNVVDSETPIVSFECPRKFERIVYDGEEHPTRFVPRTVQEETFADDDGSAELEEGERTFAMATSLQPVAGETDLEEQDNQIVEVVNVTQGVEIEAADLEVDYNTDEVTVADSAVDIDDVVKFFPILTQGGLKWHGLNSLGQHQGSAYDWQMPIYRFADMKQDQRGREINFHGGATWGRHETVELRLESEHQLVWEDADYTNAGLGAYVSTFEQDVDIEL